MNTVDFLFEIVATEKPFKQQTDRFCGLNCEYRCFLKERNGLLFHRVVSHGMFHTRDHHSVESDPLTSLSAKKRSKNGSRR